MQYEIYTDEQLDGLQNKLKEGAIDFEVINAEDKTSKKGNEMIALRLKGTDQEGNQGLLMDWLVDIPSMAYKLKHFCESVGKAADYDKGILTAEDCIGLSGVCKIRFEKSTNSDYKDSFRVKDYIKSDDKEKVVAKVKSSSPIEEPPFDDDIPF